MMLTGYGRGWQEEKAVGRIARFRQRMREPMTTTDLKIMCAVIWLLAIAVWTYFIFFRH